MKSQHLNFDPGSLRFRGVTGTGGIGNGKFFVMNGNHTLGREESRGGRFLNVRDYCKQHIILYYISKLMGQEFHVIPTGCLGDDDSGRMLYDEMKADGFVMKWIEKVTGAPTLFSFCFFYPDGSGGNLTTDDSASSMVDEPLIEKAEGGIRALGSEGMVMAAPEVPLEARKRLLELGKKYGSFCSASFTTREMEFALSPGFISNIDLISMNMDEAGACAGIKAEGNKEEDIVRSSVEKLQSLNSSVNIAITAGKNGSWCWDAHNLTWFPAIKTTAAGTSGAGDAFLAGLLCGVATGLDIPGAQQLAALVAGFSVTSPHSINKEINRHRLAAFMRSSELEFARSVINLLEE